MNYILFDDSTREALLPLTYTRPVCELRLGIMTVREKWEKYLGEKTFTLTQDYLSEKYPCQTADSCIMIAGSVCPDADLFNAIKQLNAGQMLVQSGTDKVLAMYALKEDFERKDCSQAKKVFYDKEVVCIQSLADIFMLNDIELRKDFELITKGRTSQPLSDTVTVLGSDVFVEEGATVECAVINAKEGPVYIGKDCEIMEGAVIRGPFAMNEHSVVKMGAKIYGATTLGPYCKTGGELGNVVFLGYSNKAHDGFFGNSVIGEWCNIGADSNCSNLKNTYSEVNLYSISESKNKPSGTIFCGTVMGDYSKCGINTMFNTGTVVGVCANIFGGGFPSKYIPSFSWGGFDGTQTFRLDKAIEIARTVMQRRHIEMSGQDKAILTKVFEMTVKN